MTFISIKESIDQHVAAGRLHVYVPTIIETRKFDRHIWLTEEARKWLYPTAPGQAIAYAHAALTKFYMGEYVVEGTDLKCLNPKKDEVWEFRTLFHPQARMCGWFPLQHGFIVSRCRLRADLAKVDDKKEWSAVIRQVISDRNQLFPGRNPFCGNSFADRVGNV